MEEFDLKPLLKDETYVVCRQYDLISALVLQHYTTWMHKIFERLKSIMHEDFYSDSAPQSIQLTLGDNNTLKVVTKKFTYTALDAPVDEAIKLLYCMYCVHSLEDCGLHVLPTPAEQNHLLRHLFGNEIPVRNHGAKITLVASYSEPPYTQVVDGPYTYTLKNTMSIEDIMKIPMKSRSTFLPSIVPICPTTD